MKPLPALPSQAQICFIKLSLAPGTWYCNNRYHGNHTASPLFWLTAENLLLLAWFGELLGRPPPMYLRGWHKLGESEKNAEGLGMHSRISKLHAFGDCLQFPPIDWG